MSSQASSSGGGEAEVRRKLVESGHVDAMISIRGNFFYTRSVPCELWFLNKEKPKALEDKVLMLDARNVFRKVTRKIYDFSPEQLQNLTAIVWLHRGQSDRFLKLVEGYLATSLEDASKAEKPVDEFTAALDEVLVKLGSVDDETTKLRDALAGDVDGIRSVIEAVGQKWTKSNKDNG